MNSHYFGDATVLVKLILFVGDSKSIDLLGHKWKQIIFMPLFNIKIYRDISIMYRNSLYKVTTDNKI